MVTEKAGLDERVLRLVNAALSLQQAGEAAKAMEILQKAEAQAPNYAPLQLLIGLAYRDMGKWDEAEQRLRLAIRLDPEMAPAYQALGLLLLDQKRTAEAAEFLKRHAELDPSNVATLTALTNALLKLRRRGEATKLLQSAWKKTRNTDVGIILGRYLIRIGQTERAERVLREVAEGATRPKPLAEWAYALVLLNQYEKATAVLQRAIQMDPNFDRAWRGLTDCLIPLGRYEEALRAADQALEIDDQHCRNWLAKSNALLSLGRPAEALEAALTGIRYVPPEDPEAVPVWIELRLREAECLLDLGRVDEALDRLEELRRRFPRTERFILTHFYVLRDLQRYPDMLRVLDEAVAAGLPSTGGLAPLRYETLHLLGRAEEAWEFIRPLLEKGPPQRPQILCDIGVALYREGHIAAARSIFEQLHYFAPKNARFACNLGFVLTGETGDYTDATRLMHQALEMANSEYRPTILANLGYLYLVQGGYAQAEDYLCQALAQATPEDEAILRIAYWHQGRVVPDPVSHPTQFRPISLVVKANLVTLRMAQGRLIEAEALARQMIEQFPHSPEGYEMLVSVLCALGREGEAEQARKEAARCALPADQSV